MARYKYQIFVPGGNKTALVFGLENDIAIRKTIQDKIFETHKHDADGEVEQVGFISMNKSAPQLMMTGCEFCGNATRSAVAYYLNSHEGKIEIVVSGTSKSLAAGISTTGKVWVNMPLFEDIASAVTVVDNRFYWVKMEGISHLIVPQTQYNTYYHEIFENHFDSPKTMAYRLLRKIADEHSISLGDAHGIIFLETVIDILKMHPFVHIETANTTYYETGCGSGAACVGLVSSMLFDKSVNVPLLQPSGKIIWAEIERCEKGKVRGNISGCVEFGRIHEVEC